MEAAGVQEALQVDIFRGYLREHGFDLEGGEVQEELGEQGVPDAGTREAGVNADGVQDGGLVDLAEFPEVDPRHDESDDEPVLLGHQRNPDPGFRQHLPKLRGVIGGTIPAGELPVDPDGGREVVLLQRAHRDAVAGQGFVVLPAGSHRRSRIRSRAPDLPDLLAQRGGVPLENLDGGEEEPRGGEEADQCGRSPVDLGPQGPDASRLHPPFHFSQQRFPDPLTLRVGVDADDIQDRHGVRGAEFPFLDPGDRVSGEFPVPHRGAGDETDRRFHRRREPFLQKTFPRVTGDPALDSGNTVEVVPMKGPELEVGHSRSPLSIVPLPGGTVSTSRNNRGCAG